MFSHPRTLFFVLTGILLPIAIDGLDNGLAPTPPMGWMSWSKFFCQIDCKKHPRSCINEQLYKDMADRMAEDGYLAAGYDSVIIDDCWMERERDGQGMLAPNGTRFPSGIPSLADYMHSKGLKLGIYGDIGNVTCEGYPGNWGNLNIDAKTYAEWRVDYLKLDGCNSDTFVDGKTWSDELMPRGYMEMGRELIKTGAPIVYSCSWPAYLGGPNWTEEANVNYTLIGEHCNLWRNYGDIVAPWGKPTWAKIFKIINFFVRHQDKFRAAQGPGKWNDPDMILAGNPELTVDQAKAQMTIWAIWSAPLVMSNDLRFVPMDHREILLNKRVIAVDQDPLGIYGRMVKNESNVYVFLKEMTPTSADGSQYSYAIAFLNYDNSSTNKISIPLESIGLTNPAGYSIQELWTGQELGHFNSASTLISAKLRPTSAAMYKATLAKDKIGEENENEAY